MRIHLSIQIFQRLAEEQVRGEAEKARNKDLQRSEELWRQAEELREASRGLRAGDPDAIQKIMNQYAPYRYDQGSSNDVENAHIRRKKAEAMMQRIGKDRGGWPQFSKRFCDRPILLKREPCYEGNIDTYRISCDFGITKEYTTRDCQSDILEI